LPRYAKAFYFGVILIGTIVFALGWSFNAEYQAGTSKDYEPLEGTLQLGWTPDVTYPLQYFTIQINVIENRVWMEYGFTYQKSGEYVLQILLPFTLEGDQGKGASGENWSLLNAYPYGSIVRVIYEVNSTSVGFRGAYFSRGFRVNQTLAFANRGTYTLVLPIGADVAQQLTDKMASFIPFVGICGQGTRENVVEIVAPSGAVMAQTAPRDPAIDVPMNRSFLIFRWDLGHSLPTIAVTYTIPSETDHFAGLSFMSGLLIGIGFGLVTDGVVRSYEEETHLWILNRIRRSDTASATEP
jgi:hypothetical protein